MFEVGKYYAQYGILYSDGDYAAIILIEGLGENYVFRQEFWLDNSGIDHESSSFYDLSGDGLGENFYIEVDNTIFDELSRLLGNHLCIDDPKVARPFIDRIKELCKGNWTIDMELPFETNRFKQVIIFMGIQASGKTTFYKEVLSQYDYVHVNLDTLHTRNKEMELITDCFIEERSFVIDNTNPEISDRQRYITIAKEHGYKIIGMFFQSRIYECIARNEQREEKVPAKAIPCTQNKLQFPSYDEGFDELYFVKIADEGFEITKWKE